MKCLLHHYEVVWLYSSAIVWFANNILPNLNVPIILVTAGSDESMPRHFYSHEEFLAIIENPNILHWFTQNYDIDEAHPKFSPIPIGIDFHTLAENQISKKKKRIPTPVKQEEELNQIIGSLQPTHKRDLSILVDFHLNDSVNNGFNHHELRFGEKRSSIAAKLSELPFIELVPYKIPRNELWKEKGKRAFSISPIGNGLDCHRTWEDLSLGCIVIVKSTPLNPLYEGLPVVIVNDWDEITEENLYQWLKVYGDAFENPSYREKLRTLYWVRKIHSMRA